MWRYVGLFRDANGLNAALAEIEPAWQELTDRLGDDGSLARLTTDDWHAASLLTVGRLIARAASRRDESRGGHFRLDFPERDDRRWRRRIMETRTTS